MKYKYLFGPVSSRRLGKSLGIDLLPYKTCSFNCIYCECGNTTCLTDKRQEFFLLDDIKKELDHFLSNNPELDYITMAGSGEPTLYLKIADLIKYIKSTYPQYKNALLTNSSMFVFTEILDEFLLFDLIVPSFDAASEDVFKKINRPLKTLKVSDILNGLINFKKIYKGNMYLEILFIKDINDSKKEIQKLVKASKLIAPDKVQINTIDRPPAVKEAQPCSYEELEKIASYFPNAEVIARRKKIDKKVMNIENEIYSILNTIKRRPLSINDIAEITGYNKQKLHLLLDQLEKEAKINKKKISNSVFYSIDEK